jgi:hypothetical protein
MRTWMVFGLVCAGLALTGCDADQPLDASSGGAGNVTIHVQGTATVPVWNVWDWTEDTNGNGILDAERDLDNDGRLDSGEDTCVNPLPPPATGCTNPNSNNVVLDPGEDRNGNGRLDFNEDFMVENGVLDRAAPPIGQCPACEDQNLNCVLDPGEDTNGDGILQSEDVDCDGSLDAANEDTNRNGQRDFEDTVNQNSSLDAGVWCESTGQTLTGPVPVPVAGQILLYHAGNPTPEVLADLGSSGGTSFTGLTPYDDRVMGTLAAKDVTLLSGFQLHVVEGQQLSAGSRRVMDADQAKSPGHIDPSSGSHTHNGLCTVGFDFGQPNLGVPLPIVTSATSGDIFSIRLQSAREGEFSQIENATDYAVGATVVKDGATVPPNGNNVAPPGQSVTFSVSVP